MEPPPSNGDRLESWKEVAAYLGRTEKTARRWEQTEGLPVHRLLHGERGSIYAYRSELDRWRAARTAPGHSSRGQIRQFGPWYGAVTAAILALLSAFYFWPGSSTAPTEGPLVQPAPEAPAHTSRSPEALRLYLRARAFPQNPGRTQIQTSINYLLEAVRLDPEFTAAHATLATAHVALSFLGDAPSSETMGRARSHALKALALDPSQHVARQALAGVLHWYDFDHVAAEQHFRETIAAGTRAPGPLNWYAEFLLSMGRFEDALAANRRAEEQNPAWLEVDTVRGNIYLYSGQPEQAIPHYLKALDSEPGHGLSRFFLGQAHLPSGRHAEAIAELRLADSTLGHVPFSRAGLAYALGRAGERLEADAMLAEMTERRSQAFYPAFAIALAHLGLGQGEAALDWLDRAAQERMVGYYMPNVDPAWAPLRSHPKFGNVLNRLNLSDAVPR